MSGPGDAAEQAVRGALAALDRARVVHALRTGARELHPGPGGDVDVLLDPRQARRAVRVLRRHGWEALHAPGHRGHRFVLRLLPDGRWLKLDLVAELRYGGRRAPTGPVLARRARHDGLWVAAPADVAEHLRRRDAGQRERPGAWQRLRRALPASPRRRGVVVAVLGPDGAGKGTVVTGLLDALPVARSTVYLGDRRASAAAAAPPAPAADPAGQPARPHPSPARELAFVTRKWLRLLPRLAAAQRSAWAGHVVLCDRHPLDALAVAPDRSAVARRWERVLATRLTPAPDVVLVLDAPGEVLFARKGEHSASTLETWRQGYRRLPGAVVVPTTGGTAATLAAASAEVWRGLAGRRGWRPEPVAP